MPVSYDLDQIEKDYRVGAARSFAAAMSGALTPQQKQALTIQEAMIEAAIIETKVMISAVGSEARAGAMGGAFGCHVGGTVATTLNALGEKDALEFTKAFFLGLNQAVSAMGDEKSHVATATGRPGGRA